MPELETAILSFLGGIAASLLAQWAFFRNNSKIEKMKRLSPFLESAYPVLDKLQEDVRHARSHHLHTKEREEVVRRITVTLEEYRHWFTGFRQGGMGPELESLNTCLYRHFNGLYSLADLARQNGIAYVRQNLELLDHYCPECCKTLKRQLAM